MTLQQLHYAITIAEAGSFNKAAERLFIAQPSLTGAIQELEKELGVTIFHRSGRGTTLTNDGTEFIIYARQVYQQYETLLEKYGKGSDVKKKFGVSAQHYSFVVKSFVEMSKHFDVAEYEFAIRETRTREVIDDVNTQRSEIGVLYMNDFNRKPLTKLLHSNGLTFHKLVDCGAFIYMWKHHPLAKKKHLKMEQLTPYPCLSFEQGEESAFYLAEELLSTNEYARIIKANDRATMLNLMVGLNGYTLCSGIISEELNGDDYVAVPLEEKEYAMESAMEIGYIVKKNVRMSEMGQTFIEEMKKYLAAQTKR